MGIWRAHLNHKLYNVQSLALAQQLAVVIAGASNISLFLPAGVWTFGRSEATSSNGPTVVPDFAKSFPKPKRGQSVSHSIMDGSHHFLYRGSFFFVFYLIAGLGTLVCSLRPLALAPMCTRACDVATPKAGVERFRSWLHSPSFVGDRD